MNVWTFLLKYIYGYDHGIGVGDGDGDGYGDGDIGDGHDDGVNVIGQWFTYFQSILNANFLVMFLFNHQF